MLDVGHLVNELMFSGLYAVAQVESCCFATILARLCVGYPTFEHLISGPQFAACSVRFPLSCYAWVLSHVFFVYVSALGSELAVALVPRDHEPRFRISF